MPNIEQEIEQLAENLEKSSQSPKDKLFATIRELGPEQIRAKLATLEKSDKELLLSALQEMKKAVEMDKNYAAKYVQGKITDTKIQEDKADDDQDEKLVLEAAATINHQGTPTPGWEGQVIKAKEPKKDKEETGEKKEKKAEKKIADAVDEIAEDEADEKVKEHEDKMHEKKMKKGEDMEKKQGVPKGVDPEKHERCVRKVKGDGKSKNPYAICNASMKKSDAHSATEVKEALVEIKKSVEDQLKEFGVEATPELVKSEMKRLLAEESQDGNAPKMDEKTRANKENVPELEIGKDNKAAQAKVNDEKQGMKKSASWSDENALLKANTLGRNFTYDVGAHLEAEAAEAAKPKEEPVQKSESGKEDINDIIQKGGDANWDMVNTERMLKANKQRGTLVKSFENKEIQEALGLSDEEAKKILGE